MKYEVAWNSNAESDLAKIWMSSSERAKVAESAAYLDDLLARNPFSVGESRTSTVQRIAYKAPLGVEFEIIEDDKRVIVHAVFSA